jgi:hypothetical protein
MENSTEFHGIHLHFPWNSIEFYETEVDGIPWKIPWNSMEKYNEKIRHKCL